MPCEAICTLANGTNFDAASQEDRVRTASVAEARLQQTRPATMRKAHTQVQAPREASSVHPEMCTRPQFYSRKMLADKVPLFEKRAARHSIGDKAPGDYNDY